MSLRFRLALARRSRLVGRVRSDVPTDHAPAGARSGRRGAPAVGRRCGEAGARAEPRHPDRADQPADPGRRRRPGAQLLGAERSPPASTTTRPATRRPARCPAARSKITDSHVLDAVRRHPDAADRRQLLRSAGTAPARRSTNIFNNFDPLLSSNVASERHAAAAAELQDRQHPPAARAQQEVASAPTCSSSRRSS